MYNSSAGSNQNDADLTMIDQSYLYGDNDQPISNSVVRHMQQANQSTTSKSHNIDNRHDYVHIERDRLQLAEQIEQILKYYRQELKQETNTLLDCNQQLIIRLVDFIRPIYSSQRKKLKNLDDLYEDISVLQALPFIEQKEKQDQLNNEILHLKKLIITSANEDDRSDNTMTKVYRIDSMINYEQWMEMEEETKKLSNLVETQRDKINELIKIISQEDEASIPIQQPTTSNINPESTSVTPKNQSSGTNKIQKSTDVFHSPGASPLHSLTDFLTKSPIDTVNNEKPPIIPARALPVLSRISSYNDMKKCPICNYEFLLTTDDFAIYTHVERCLTSSDIDPSIPIEPKQYACPNCNQQFPDNDEVYLRHLTDCFNQRTDIF